MAQLFPSTHPDSVWHRAGAWLALVDIPRDRLVKTLPVKLATEIPPVNAATAATAFGYRAHDSVRHHLACDNASRAWDVAVFATAHAVAASSHPAITCRKFRLEGCGTAKAGARLR